MRWDRALSALSTLLLAAILLLLVLIYGRVDDVARITELRDCLERAGGDGFSVQLCQLNAAE